MKKQVNTERIRPSEDSVERALSQVGDRWSFLILREAFFGARRYESFARKLDAAPSVLADRLKKLVDYDILERRAYSERPPRYEYRLSAKGLDVYPAIVSLMQWGDRWLAGEEGPPIALVHSSCGKTTKPHVVCNRCAKPIEARGVTWKPARRRVAPRDVDDA